MLITLFTDVSLDPRSQIGAYAWWAKADGITFRGADLFREAIDDSNVAEIYGVINGVFAAIRQIDPPAGSKFIAQSDSGIAIGALQGTYGSVKYGHLRSMLCKKLIKHGLQIEYRHVKAHKGNSTPRHAVNSWCDRTARAVMRTQRDQAVTHET